MHLEQQFTDNSQSETVLRKFFKDVIDNRTDTDQTRGNCVCTDSQKETIHFNRLGVDVNSSNLSERSFEKTETKVLKC